MRLGNILRRYGRRYRRKRRCLLKRCQQRDRALRELAACGTQALGGHAMECQECGHAEYRWNACKNRNCPQCNGGRRKRWFEERREELVSFRGACRVDFLSVRGGRNSGAGYNGRAGTVDRYGAQK